MIEAVEGKGVNRARVICDECQRAETVTCDYARKAGGKWAPNEGQILRKMSGQKWELVKGQMFCPTCNAKRKSTATTNKTEQPKKVEQMADTKEKLREPTLEQRREIISLLVDVYDAAAKGYKPGESDKTVADAVGGGVLWGWVAKLREDNFGPDTRSEEVESLRKAVSDLEEKLRCQAKALDDAVAQIKQAEDRFGDDLSKIRDRLGKMQ